MEKKIVTINGRKTDITGICTLLSLNQKLLAMKELKEATGLDLKECKDYLDKLEGELHRSAATPPPLPPSGKATTTVRTSSPPPSAPKPQETHKVEIRRGGNTVVEKPQTNRSVTAERRENTMEERRPVYTERTKSEEVARPATRSANGENYSEQRKRESNSSLKIIAIILFVILAVLLVMLFSHI